MKVIFYLASAFLTSFSEDSSLVVRDATVSKWRESAASEDLSPTPDFSKANRKIVHKNKCYKSLQTIIFKCILGVWFILLQSTLGFATMGKAANLGLATINAVTDLF